jgi:site-specific DNA recombinase
MVLVTSRGLRLLAYGRVSDVRGRTGESFISPEDQMRRCRDYAGTYDHTIIEEGLDLDVSGGVMSRPTLDRFLEEIKACRAQGLIVAKLDRFSRSSRGALNALAEIEAAGGVLISVQEQIDSTTAAGRFVRSIFLATAEWERERIGESWLSAKTSAVARGVHISRHCPPGYVRNGDSRLSPHPRDGQTIAKAFSMAAEGESYSAIATYLNQRGLSGSETWQPNRIKRLLANRVYLGEARYGEITNPDAHEPLVDEVTWSVAQRYRPETPTLGKNATNLLAGLVRCAGCSFAMRPQAARGSTVASYRCTTTTAHGRCPAPSTISASRIEDYVIERFLAANRLAQPFSRTEEDDEALVAAQEEVVRAEHTYRNALTDTKLRAQIGDVDHSQMVADLHAEWQEAIANAQALMPRGPSVGSSVDLPALVERLKQEDVSGLRELLGSAIQAVFVRPAASRAKALPVSDRVKVVFHEEEQLELPRRGSSYEPRAYSW